MVAEKYDDGAVGKAGPLEFRKLFADPGIHFLDPVEVLAPVPAHLGGVGPVGGKGDRGGVACDPVLVPDLAFVGDGVVEDGEKGLVGGAVAVVGLGGGFVPDLAGFFDAVVLLGIVGAVVARLGQFLRKHGDSRRQTDHRPHGFGTDACGVPAENDSGPRGRANRGV